MKSLCKTKGPRKSWIFNTRMCINLWTAAKKTITVATCGHRRELKSERVVKAGYSITVVNVSTFMRM